MAFDEYNKIRKNNFMRLDLKNCFFRVTPNPGLKVRFSVVYVCIYASSVYVRIFVHTQVTEWRMIFIAMSWCDLACESQTVEKFQTVLFWIIFVFCI